MSFKVWLKVNAADKALTPVREELVALLDAGSSVLDIGCGTGDLLFRAASKIGKGHGVDLDRQMIQYAGNKARENSISNLRFDTVNAMELQPGDYDVATSTLCLHELDEKDACEILEYMAKTSSRVLIADYSQPETFLAHIGIEFDEIVSGHYSKFRHYRKAGRIPAYAYACNLVITRTIKSSIDGIVIWEINGKSGA